MSVAITKLGDALADAFEELAVEVVDHDWPEGRLSCIVKHLGPLFPDIEFKQIGMVVTHAAKDLTDERKAELRIEFIEWHRKAHPELYYPLVDIMEVKTGVSVNWLIERQFEAFIRLAPSMTTGYNED